MRTSRTTAWPWENIVAGPVWGENLGILFFKMAHTGLATLYVWATAGL